VGLFKKGKEARRRKEELVRRNPQLMAGQDTYTFRRSRTLTGSSSSSIKAANETQAQIKSPRLKSHELRQHRRRVTTALFGCLILAGALYWLLTQFVANITTISYNPIVKRQAEHMAYIETIQSYLRTHPFERFRFALNKEAMLEYLQSKMPEVASINSIEGQGIGSGAISLGLRRPVVGWKVGSQQYYVDANGVSFRHNYFDSPGVTVRDQSGISPTTNGGAIASNRFLSFLGRVVALSTQMGVGKVTTVTIPAGVGTRTVEIKLAGREASIRMHIDRDPAAQVEDTKRTFQYLDSKGVIPHSVDVRVTGKAFYR
jgi:cell division septal protein FtsQ